MWLRTADLTMSGDIAAPLGDLEFNTKTSIRERFKKQLGVDWSAPDQVVINIPAFDAVKDIAVPANTVDVTLQLAVTASSLNGNDIDAAKTSIHINYKPGVILAQHIQLSYTNAPGSIYLVVAALKYMVTNKGKPQTLQAEQWLPVSVIDGYYKS